MTLSKPNYSLRAPLKYHHIEDEDLNMNFGRYKHLFHGSNKTEEFLKVKTV